MPFGNLLNIGPEPLSQDTGITPVLFDLTSKRGGARLLEKGTGYFPKFFCRRKFVKNEKQGQTLFNAFLGNYLQSLFLGFGSKLFPLLMFVFC